MPDVQMDFGQMQDMRRVFTEAADTLDGNISGLKLIVTLVSGGALVGKGAEDFINLLEGGILPFSQRIHEKLLELAADVEGARASLEDGDETAASRFH